MNARFYLRDAPFELVSPLWGIGTLSFNFNSHTYDNR